MKFRRREFLHLAVSAAALPTLSRIASAQTYPTRPITMIVPFAAGGGTDVIARIVAEHMSRTLGQQVIIENVAGAGGTTGSLRAMRASADGQRACPAQWDARKVKLKSSYHRANVELGKLATNGSQRRLADSCRATIWMRTASVRPCFSLSRGWGDRPGRCFRSSAARPGRFELPTGIKSWTMFSFA
jgi:Tripartite tricarboxylate transporter family receptor